MATGAEHYRHAEQLLTDLRDALASMGRTPTPQTVAHTLAIAQVHATLAHAAATALSEGGMMPGADFDAWAAAAGTKTARHEPDPAAFLEAPGPRTPAGIVRRAAEDLASYVDKRPVTVGGMDCTWMSLAADSWQHQADDMADHGAHMDATAGPKGWVIGDRRGTYRPDWTATVRAALAFLGEDAPEAYH